jgi:hypothetical protein
MPPRALDDALAHRFRVEELHAGFDGLHFSQPFGWGEVADDGVGIKSVSSETVIDGDLALGSFTYDSCDDSVSAPATVDFATRDELLATTAHGALTVRHYELGWPRDGAPSIELYAHDDLTAARGSLDLMLDPTTVQEADMTIALAGTPDALRGSVRVRVSEYRSEEERLASHAPSDMNSATAILERAAAEFPIDRCTPEGQPAHAGEPLAVLAGTDPAELAGQLRALLLAARGLESSWFGGGLRTQLSIDPGDAEPEPDCAGQWWVSFAINGHATSADGRIDDALTHAVVEIAPYSTFLSAVSLEGEHCNVHLQVDSDGRSSNGWVDDFDDNDSLAWPPCTHSEPCSASAP